MAGQYYLLSLQLLGSLFHHSNVRTMMNTHLCSNMSNASAICGGNPVPDPPLRHPHVLKNIENCIRQLRALNGEAH